VTASQPQTAKLVLDADAFPAPHWQWVTDADAFGDLGVLRIGNSYHPAIAINDNLEHQSLLLRHSTLAIRADQIGRRVYALHTVVGDCKQINGYLHIV
jgi:hypothetical protein